MDLKHLGKQSQQPVETLDLIPWEGGGAVIVRLDCFEFTSHCPVTRQPDFGKLSIEYRPAKYLAETKSMKLFLWQFREQAQFNEVIVDSLAKLFFEQVKPFWVRVKGEFNTRGGISVTAESYLEES